MFEPNWGEILKDFKFFNQDQQCDQKVKTNHRSLLNPLRLNSNDTYMYNKLINSIDDNHLKYLYDLSQEKVYKGRVITGRLIDTFFVHYMKLVDVNYFIDSDGKINFDGHGDHIDLRSRYFTRSQELKKEYFDIFKRGKIIQHTMKNNVQISLSICNMNFYIWMEENKVLDIIHILYDDIKLFISKGITRTKSKFIVIQDGEIIKQVRVLVLDVENTY